MQDVFFCYLLKTKAKAIIKANAIIVTDIKPINSNFINNNKTSISIIRTTSISYVGGNHILLSLKSL